MVVQPAPVVKLVEIVGSVEPGRRNVTVAKASCTRADISTPTPGSKSKQFPAVRK